MDSQRMVGRPTVITPPFQNLVGPGGYRPDCCLLSKDTPDLLNVDVVRFLICAPSARLLLSGSAGGIASHAAQDDVLAHGEQVVPGPERPRVESVKLRAQDGNGAGVLFILEYAMST